MIDFYGPVFDHYLRAAIVAAALTLFGVGFGAGLFVGWWFL